MMRYVPGPGVAFQWRQGDVLLIDNSLVMHSRDTFVPPRRVLVALRGPPILGASEKAPAHRRTSTEAERFHNVTRTRDTAVSEDRHAIRLGQLHTDHPTSAAATKNQYAAAALEPTWVG